MLIYSPPKVGVKKLQLEKKIEVTYEFQVDKGRSSEYFLRKYFEPVIKLINTVAASNCRPISICLFRIAVPYSPFRE